ncbi:MAG: DUF695 domain-containing protein [Muribaculaceae bacterium]|nr:DUF695 domain-containing protein [Muribaculaceae bacterium]
MAEKDDWITYPTVDDNGNTIIVTGRLDVEKFRSRERNNIRVEITLPYTVSGHLGFPDDESSRLLEAITNSFEANLKGKNTAILTGIYTGAGERNWVFYTFATQVFNSFLNRALADFPLLPLKIYAENDPDWAEYDEMIGAITES